jgi:hypothetical protein
MAASDDHMQLQTCHATAADIAMPLLSAVCAATFKFGAATFAGTGWWFQPEQYNTDDVDAAMAHCQHLPSHILMVAVNTAGKITSVKCLQSHHSPARPSPVAVTVRNRTCYCHHEMHKMQSV